MSRKLLVYRLWLFLCRQIGDEEYKAWAQKHDEAKTSLHGREDKLAEVAELIEVNMSLLGATGIEDKLQQVAVSQ